MSGRERTHALRNHLGVVVGLVEFLLEDTPAANPRHADLRDALDPAVAAAKLVAADTAVEA